jgi:glycosyltransferase involved in cell wall biosynthesis
VYKGLRIFVVIPCFNVERHVAAVVASVPDYVDGIVAVDDASTDSTGSVLRGLADTRLGVVSHERNQGVGGATISGFCRASDAGADILVKVDGDGQMDLSKLPALLDPIAEESYDYAKGNRLLAEASLSAMPRTRLLGNFGLTFLTKLASGYWQVVDPQNGFVAISAKAWNMIDRNRLARGYFFENDMLVSLNILRARVRDVTMPARYGDEVSNLRVRSVMPSFALLLLRRTIHRFYMKYVLRDFSPIALFVFAGLPLFVWGILFGAFEWIDHARRDVVTPTGTVMLSVLPLLIGFELLLQALVLDIQDTPR